MLNAITTKIGFCMKEFCEKLTFLKTKITNFEICYCYNNVASTEETQVLTRNWSCNSSAKKAIFFSFRLPIQINWLYVCLKIKRIFYQYIIEIYEKKVCDQNKFKFKYQLPYFIMVDAPEANIKSIGLWLLVLRCLAQYVNTSRGNINW